MTDYHPIFFEKNFSLQKYYGWRLLNEEKGFLHLYRKQAVFHRHLLMFESVSPEELKRRAESAKIEGMGSVQVYVFDPSAEFGDAIDVGGRRFQRCGADTRMFNTWTFVHDLTRPEEELWKGFAKGARYVCKSAEKAALDLRIARGLSEGTLEKFFSFYAVMAKERGLRMPERAVLERMLGNQDLLAVECRDSGGDLLQVLLIYLSAPYAIYLYGVSNPTADKEYGQYLHFQVMKTLRQSGLRWYDLGGVPAISEENGIFRFKKSMGGKLIGPCVEFGYWHPMYRIGRKVHELLRP